MPNHPSYCLCQQEEGTALDRRGRPSWDVVGQLAAVLLESRGLAITAVQADRIRQLWGRLEPADRQRLQFGGLPFRTKVRGRFKRRYRSDGYTGVEAMGRFVRNYAFRPLIIFHKVTT